jgi:hypothetical protein
MPLDSPPPSHRERATHSSRRFYHSFSERWWLPNAKGEAMIAMIKEKTDANYLTIKMIIKRQKCMSVG